MRRGAGAAAGSFCMWPRIQSRLFSVGFVVSGLPPRHTGTRAVLRVPRHLWWAEIPANSTPFRFRSALGAQKIVENSAHLANAERVSGQRVMRVSGERRSASVNGSQEPSFSGFKSAGTGNYRLQ